MDIRLSGFSTPSLFCLLLRHNKYARAKTRRARTPITVPAITPVCDFETGCAVGGFEPGPGVAAAPAPAPDDDDDDDGPPVGLENAGVLVGYATTSAAVSNSNLSNK